MGLLACGATEALELFCLYYEALAAVALCFFLTLIVSAIFLTCQIWRHNSRRRFFLGGLLLAVAMGVISGLWGGSDMKQYWIYHEANAQENTSPSAKPSMFDQKNVFHFVERAYVNTKLTGVVYRTSNLTYCVAPILGKDPAPQSAVLYWAVSTSCCAGLTKDRVVQNCHHWTDWDLTGEETTVDADFYKLAVAKTADWNNFAVQPDALFVVLMTRDEQRVRQNQRYLHGLLVLCLAPVLWPSLALFMVLLRTVAICMCGVKSIEPISSPH